MDVEKLYDSQYLKSIAKSSYAESKKLIKKIKAKKTRQLDSLFNNLHQKAFSKIDCLECANCCKGLGPRITDKDIERLSKFLKIKPNKFIDDYLKIDEDDDYVFIEIPCPFLAPDNYCIVYESRPKACRDYPHTDHKKMIKHLNLALKNAETCPAVYLIVEDLKTIPINDIK